MTAPLSLEERICRTVNRLAVVERLFELETTLDADESDHEGAVRAGVHALILESYEDLEPITNAPGAIANWVPDEQPEPDTPAGEDTAPPAA